MTLINPFGFSQNISTDTNHKTTWNQPAVRDYTKFFQLSDAQQKSLKEQSDCEKQLREAARGGAGQGQAESLKRRMLYERLKLLQQQVALMNKQAAKAAMAEVKRIAGELRQMSAQPATAAASDTEESTSTAEARSASSATNEPTSPPTPGVNIPQASTTSGQPGEKSTNETAPIKNAAASKTQAGDDLEELKQMLKRILRALKKRMEDAPDSQVGTTNTRQQPEPPATGMFIDIKV